MPADSLVLQRAALDPGWARPPDILALQRAYGNRAVTGLIQAKLTVGPVGDRYEQEADRVAQQVMGMPTPVAVGQAGKGSQLAQRQAEEEEVQMKPARLGKGGLPLVASITPLVQRQQEEEEVQMKRRQGADGSFQASPGLQTRLAAHQGGGQPLPAHVRAFMEPRFGADFSNVRVHTDSEAVQMSQRLSAQAFTHGQDIYMSAGQYRPGSEAGKRLLAHELTHVVQQTGRAPASRQSGAVQARSPRTLQRILAFKPSDLQGQLTFKAKMAGLFGKKSTWAQIRRTLLAYWADPKHPITLLTQLDNLVDQWLARHGSSSNPNDQLKKQSLVKLQGEIQAEYGSIMAPLSVPASTPSTGSAMPPPKHVAPTKPLPPVPTKHKPLPPVPTGPTGPTATTPSADLSTKALTELAPVGIAPQLLSKFPPADLQLLLNAHTALTNRDVVAADSALTKLKTSADPTVQAVFNLVKTYLMRYHIGALAPEVQQIFNPHFKLSDTAPLDQQAFQTAKDYLENPATAAKTGGATPLGQAAQKARATIADYKALHPVEVLAIEAYTSELYKEINTALRQALAPKSGMTKEQIAWAKATVSGLHKLPPAPVKEVYRHDGIFPGFLETHQPGAVVTDFAFKSSAQRQEGCSQGGAGHDVLSVIQQKSGLDVAGTAYFGKGEAEVLFPPGVQFRVDERADQVLGSGPAIPDWTPAPVKPKAESYWKKETTYKGNIKTILFMSEV
ncbi:MAG: DUF4157 domain-containing protein [Anaerolineales bacterium]|nr:MAG: DUF4157 domain-containing protein [Anaerolineales bacterium]